MENVLIIAGPSGSGKTTIGVYVSDLMGYYHFDAGLLWRYLTLRLIAHKVDLADESACVDAANQLLALAERLDYWSFHGLIERWADSGALSAGGLGSLTSKIATYPRLQQIVSGILQSFYTPAGYVVVGRPWLYEAVFPDAFFKVLLIAPETIRAARNQEGESQAQMADRDERDQVKAVSLEQLATVDLVLNTNRREPEDLATQIAAAACPLIPVEHRFVPKVSTQILIPAGINAL